MGCNFIGLYFIYTIICIKEQFWFGLLNKTAGESQCRHGENMRVTQTQDKTVDPGAMYTKYRAYSRFQIKLLLYRSNVVTIILMCNYLSFLHVLKEASYEAVVLGSSPGTHTLFSLLKHVLLKTASKGLMKREKQRSSIHQSKSYIQQVQQYKCLHLTGELY